MLLGPSAADLLLVNDQTFYVNQLRRRSRRDADADDTQVRSLPLPHLNLAPAKGQLKLLDDVHNLQQVLASVNDNPMLGLQEAAELLTDHLGVDLVA
jgi:hypothetical protein